MSFKTASGRLNPSGRLRNLEETKMEEEGRQGTAGRQKKVIAKNQSISKIRWKEAE